MAFSEFQTCRALMDSAREKPDEDSVIAACSALQACSALAVIQDSESIRKLYESQNYLFFVRDMLDDSRVSSNSAVVQILYNTFQEILKVLGKNDIFEAVHTLQMVNVFVGFFIRDATSFKNLLPDVLSAANSFISDLKDKELISTLKDLDFHSAMCDVLSSCDTANAVCVTVQLLVIIEEKYWECLQVSRSLHVSLVDIILKQARVMHSYPDFDDNCDVLFSSNFDKVLQTFLTDKDTSRKLFEDDYLSKLLEVFDSLGNTHIRGGILYAVGDMADSMDQAKNILLERRFYGSLITILNESMDEVKPSLTGACCDVLSILALGDIVKKRYVKSGFMKNVLNIFLVLGDNHVLYTALRLLGSISDINIMNRHLVVTSGILELLRLVLQTTEQPGNIQWTLSILADFCELDIGPIALAQFDMNSILLAAIADPAHCEQSPMIGLCGRELLEKMFLYTIPKVDQFSILPTSSESYQSYWPPHTDNELYLEDDEFTTSTQGEPSVNIPQLGNVKYLEAITPTAPELSDSARQELSELGLDPGRQVFRVGRLYGATYSNCPNCVDHDITNYFSYFVIRPSSMTMEQYQGLVDCGWYRMGRVNMYRLINCHRIECCNWETRISVKEFDRMKHRSNKKILKKISDVNLTIEKCRAHFSKEAFALYNDYHVKKHKDHPKSVEIYCDHVVNTPITHQAKDDKDEVEYGTFHMLYRIDGKLVAVSVVDVIPKGMISVYMWYDVNKDVAKYSLGKYSILKEIEMVRELSEKAPEMKYYYLQGWNGKNMKLSYKGDYEPEEFYCPCLVSNWVCGLEGVEKRVKELIETESRPNEIESDFHEDGLSLEKKLKMDPTLDIATKRETEERDAFPPRNDIENRAFPFDLMRCEAGCGGGSVDISKVVICLNHRKYVHLQDLIKHVDEAVQREIMETRIKELYVALPPELRSKLVIDMIDPDRL